MYRILFKHHWLKSVRSLGFHKNMIINIFMGISVAYFLAIFILMGFMLPKLLEKIAPGQDVATTFNGLTIYEISPPTNIH